MIFFALLCVPAVGLLTPVVAPRSAVQHAPLRTSVILEKKKGKSGAPINMRGGEVAMERMREMREQMKGPSEGDKPVFKIFVRGKSIWCCPTIYDYINDAPSEKNLYPRSSTRVARWAATSNRRA